MADPIHTHRLDGCAPAPLADYLKALGVLRLLSMPENRVAGTAADPTARGWWAEDRFHLATRLDRGALLAFFLESYAPTPVIAPWNGGSGFYAGDNLDGFQPLAEAGVAARFRPYGEAIACAVRLVAELAGAERPAGERKVAFVAALRAELPDAAIAWLDAALALSGGGLAYPQLLGTGGNDGRLDFTNNFMRRLVSRSTPVGMFDAETGHPTAGSGALLEAALFRTASWELTAAAIGQFAPGASGGANATAGFEADGSVNPWDFILMLEGAIAFAGAATRRHQGMEEAGASFPFTVRATAAGSGAVAPDDEASARAEFWAPLWHRGAVYSEIAALLGEGRAVLGGRTARDGLEFARSASALGVSRGIAEFQRFGFVMRSGKAYLATPLGRRGVRECPDGTADLIAELEEGDWLGRMRRLARNKATPARARNAARWLEDALFDMAGAERAADGAQNCLMALGDLAGWLATSREGREKLAPPPRLSPGWMEKAADISPEFAVAAALASVGWPSVRKAGEVAETAGATQEPQPRPLPMAAHFVPVEAKSIARRQREWAAETPAAVVWGAGPLAANLVAVLDRRLVEQARGGSVEKPTGGARPASLEAILAFLEGGPVFDDARCARLLAGLVWMRPRRRRHAASERSAPFAYAALKPILAPDGEVADICKEWGAAFSGRLDVPPGLLARLRRGDIDGAVQAALARARASGLASPFEQRARHAPRSRFGVGLDGMRLAAALLIPIAPADLRKLIERAFPGAKGETTDAA